MKLSTRMVVLGRKFDTDAQAYITAVETADGAALEGGVKTAINNFVVGCKADGIWSAIKASCILAGARTLSGALIPLAGVAPTNFNFVSGDYNRKTGLVGNGSSKYLNTNRNGNVDPQNNKHGAVYITSLPTAPSGPFLAHDRNSSIDTNGLFIFNGLTRLNDNQSFQYIAATGFVGLSRSTSSAYNRRNGSVTSQINASSRTPFAKNHILYADALQNGPQYSNACLAFYSIGEFLDLTLLDARVTTLINTYNTVIA
jgi:hypothetical protein